MARVDPERVCARCLEPKDALVGLGVPPDWMCLECYEQEMLEIGAKVRRYLRSKSN